MTPSEFKKELLVMVNQSLVRDPDCLEHPAGYELQVDQVSFVVNPDKLDRFRKQVKKMKIRLPKSLEAQITKATADAGRGNVLSIVDITPCTTKKSGKPSRPTLCPHCDTYCYGDCQA